MNCLANAFMAFKEKKATKRRCYPVHEHIKRVANTLSVNVFSLLLRFYVKIDINTIALKIA